MQSATRKSGDLLSRLLDTLPKPMTAGAARAVTVGLLGRGIGPSRSPAMHEREGARLGLSYAYHLLDFDRLGLEGDALGAVVEATERLGYAGLNVTHPFKQCVIPHLTGLVPEAESIGAVNTIVFDGRRRIGHNTDCWGFAESFREQMEGCSLAEILLFGAGGAGAAVAHALLELGADRLALVDSATMRAEALAAALGRRFDGRVTALADPSPAFGHATGIVNATPVGMAKYPGLPFVAEHISPRHWVADIVYFPAETELLRQARSRGCRTLSGTGMAVYQAVRAFELFTGIAPDKAAMRRHFREGGAEA